MRIYSLAQLTNEEKENILNKHRTLYNGYRTIQPNVSNTQDLYVQDFANDKNGITVNNKGVVKNYTNIKINENYVNEQKKQVCGECGGMMTEGECVECGWRNEGEVEENYKDELIGDEPKWEREFGHEDLEDLTKKEPSKKPFRPKVDLGKSFEKLKDQILGKKDIDEEKSVCSECGGAMNEGECMECGYKMEGIYDVDDIDDSNEFDYVEEQMLSPKDQMNKAKEPYNFVSQGPMLSMEDADFEEMEPAFSEEDFIDSEEIDFEDLKNDEDFVDADQIDIEDVEETWDDVEDDVKEEFIKEKNKISEMFYRINKFN